MPQITVIIPVYNVQDYLEQCIKSVLAQDYKDYEVILIDDGSTDKSGDICDQYAMQSEQIHVIHQENKGLSEARNAGMSIAAGNYIMFLDSDDFIHPHTFKWMYESAQRKHAEITVCKYCLYYKGDRISYADNYHITMYSGREAAKKIVKESQRFMITAWGKLYAREVLNGLQFPVGKLHEDEYLTYQILYRAKRVVCVEAPLWYYVQRNHSIMGEYQLKRLDKLQALARACVFFREKQDGELYLWARYRYLFHLTIAYYRVKMELNEKEKVCDQIKQIFDRHYKLFYKSKRQIPWKNRSLLWLFFRFPEIYCGLAEIYIKTFLEELV